MLAIALSLLVSIFVIFRMKTILSLQLPMWVLVTLFLVKIGAAFAIADFYDDAEEREMADVYKFYDNGLILADAFKEDPLTFFKLMCYDKSDDPVFTSYEAKIKYWGGKNHMNDMKGNRLLIRTNAALSIIFFKNYQANLIVFTLFSFIGLLLLLAFTHNYIELPSGIVLAIATLSPSVLFWSSGILKEPLVILAIGTFFFCLSRRRAVHILAAAISLCILYVIKLPLLICILPAALLYMIYNEYDVTLSKSLGLVVATTIVIGTTAVVFLDYDIIDSINQKRLDYVNAGKTYEAESLIHSAALNSFWDALAISPKAFTTALYRPSIFEIRKSSYLPFAIESIGLVLMLLLALFFRKSKIQDLLDKLCAFLWVIIPFALIIGYTVPILGSVVRYRAPIIPLYILACLILTDWARVLPSSSRLLK